MYSTPQYTAAGVQFNTPLHDTWLQEYNFVLHSKAILYSMLVGYWTIRGCPISYQQKSVVALEVALSDDTNATMSMRRSTMSMRRSTTCTCMFVNLVPRLRRKDWERGNYCDSLA